MSTMGPVSRALYGAYRLARLDPDGMTYFEANPEGFWHSFTAAIVVLPLFIGTMLARWFSLPDTVSGLRFISIEIIAYVIAWTAFPVLMVLVARAIKKEQHYIRGIVAYNWAAVLQNLLYMPVAILSLTGVDGTEPLAMLILFLVMFYSWFVIKTAMQLRPLTAWGIVALDLLISMVLSVWADTLILS